MSALARLSGLRSALKPHQVLTMQRAWVESGPPRVYISNKEKAAHGVVMIALIMATPCWILSNILKYRERPT